MEAQTFMEGGGSDVPASATTREPSLHTEAVVAPPDGPAAAKLLQDSSDVARRRAVTSPTVRAAPCMGGEQGRRCGEAGPGLVPC